MKYTIIGKHECSENDMKVECDCLEDMIKYRDKMLSQGYKLIINEVR